MDFAEGTLTVREGKAKRVDVLPLHPQLADALRERKAARMAVGSARVFPETVTDRTRQRDFLRAGLAREEVVTDANGEPVLIGEGKRERPKTRIVCEDEEGRVIDLHALRTTLGTQLARAGVAPQIAQRVMRHGDYRTTLAHYTVLGLTDTAGAVNALPVIGDPEGEAERATGTADARAGVRAAPPAVHPATGARNGAFWRASARRSGRGPRAREAQKPHEKRPLRACISKAGDRARTGNIQLGRLTLYH